MWILLQLSSSTDPAAYPTPFPCLSEFDFEVEVEFEVEFEVIYHCKKYIDLPLYYSDDYFLIPKNTEKVTLESRFEYPSKYQKRTKS